MIASIRARYTRRRAMKIQCSTCNAKYTIADEKVLGKVVKIRCKKCSSTIIVNGNEATSLPHDEGSGDVGGSGAEASWLVNVADGDQRTLTIAEIAMEYRAGAIDDETYCWKDGMADWLPLRDIDTLRPHLARGPLPSLHDETAVGNPGVALLPGSSLEEADGHGLPLEQGLMLEREVPAERADAPGAVAALSTELASAASSTTTGEHAQPAAARRGGGRGQGADLFGSVAAAGSDDDVTTSARPTNGVATSGVPTSQRGSDDRRTGQRNESSVLFSLGSLTSAKGATENRTTATADGSGLIDIRALSQTMSKTGDPRSQDRVDDIMNLSGGGAFGASLAAPILSPSPLEIASSNESHEKKSSAVLLLGLLGGSALIACAIVIGVLLSRQPTVITQPAPSLAATQPMDRAAETPQPQIVVASPAPTGTEAPVAARAAPARTPAGGFQGAQPATKELPKSAEPAPAPKSQSTNLADALANAAGKPGSPPPAAPAGGTGAFDRGAAAAALGNINVQSCRKSDGPTGSGHVIVTFSPNGTVASAVVDSGPFPGTVVGGCIAGKFRGAHVPAFSGASVNVGKSFTIN